jgi:hypothetical protein
MKISVRPNSVFNHNYIFFWKSDIIWKCYKKVTNLSI